MSYVLMSYFISPVFSYVLPPPRDGTCTPYYLKIKKNISKCPIPFIPTFPI